MDVIPLQSLRIPKLIISETDNAKLYLKDIQISGLCEFVINSLHMDVDKNHVNVQASFKHVAFNSTYDFDIRVLVPIAATGECYFTTGT